MDLFIDIRSEAVLHCRFINLDEKAILRSRDRVDPDPGLLRFGYDYDIDEIWMKLSGLLMEGALERNRM